MAQMKTRIELPKGLSPNDREIILEEVVDFIKKRTRKGKDKDNRSFAAYSKEYKQSLDFKNAGKSGSKVNLVLSGDMLAALDVLSHRNGSGFIGYESGTEENSRAEGNIKGTYGQRKPISGKKRDFLGITEKDLEKVLNSPRVVERLEIDVSELPDGKLGVGIEV